MTGSLRKSGKKNDKRNFISALEMDKEETEHLSNRNFEKQDKIKMNKIKISYRKSTSINDWNKRQHIGAKSIKKFESEEKWNIDCQKDASI